MTETEPEENDRPDIPDEPPPAGGGEAAIPDQPMGVPAEGEPHEAPSPGIPDREPPTSG